ncbi:MAG: PD40 domain-containing protein [Phycisphaerales bacterium]|nr:PD40 domain-containing protein [Phycisphaerales bacterium]
MRTPNRTWLLTGLLGVLALGGTGLLLAATRTQPTPAASDTHDESLWFRNVRQLTSKEMGFERAGEAYFSADGRKICFQAYPLGKEDYQIYIMNLDGSDLKMISTGAGATTCAYFHPSGEKVLFASNHEDLRPPADFEPMRPRGEERGAGHDSAGERPAGHPGGGASDDAAPAQERPRHGGGGAASRGYAWRYYPGMQIYEYTLATGELKRLTNTDAYDAEGSYSPCGKYIVFSSFRDGDQEIYIMDADGNNPRRVTNTPGGDGGPFFSPDGKRIVYRSDRTGSGNLQIFVNRFAGDDERAVTDNRTFHWCPFWHPSNKWLIYTHADHRGRPNFDLYLVRDDGSERYRVTSQPDFDGLPVFSPDGRYLMWTSKREGVETPQLFIAEFLGLTPDGELRVRQQSEPARP